MDKTVDSSHTYHLNGTALEQVEEEKDIGVVIDNELSFAKHISDKCNKTTSMFAMLRRTFHFMDAEIFKPLYKSLVRTHLEYASSVWALYNINTYNK
jgi:hypothetical protein